MRFLLGPLRVETEIPETIVRPQQFLKLRLITGARGASQHLLTTPETLENSSRFEQEPSAPPPARNPQGMPG